MFNKTINKAVKYYLSKRFARIENMRSDPHTTQKRVLKKLLSTASDTLVGKKYCFNKIQSEEDFRNAVPLCQYEDIVDNIYEMMHGHEDILWPGKINWFAKSSGTTDANSKYIPMSKTKLYNCHIAGAWDAMAIIYNEHSSAKMFAEKSIILSGSLQRFAPHKKSIVGDVSAILVHHMPAIGRPFFVPEMEIALEADIEKKLNGIADKCIKENIVSISGVPTWAKVLFDRILEKTGKDNILEVWPQLEYYMHGGVGFNPYKAIFEQYLPGDQVNYFEIYNATEGYFAIQDITGADDMLLLLDNSIYYEFIPLDALEKGETVPLSGVKKGIQYVMVITTASGLWRYIPGDTVIFSSILPYRLRVSGRTKQFINAFGEELMIENAERAIAKTCEQFDSRINDYTVAPIYMASDGKGAHEWLIEFESEPDDIDLFCEHLDLNIQKLNSDYEAKRQSDLALSQLLIHQVPKGTFRNWMHYKGKNTVQSKIPRLSNNRVIIEEILSFIDK